MAEAMELRHLRLLVAVHETGSLSGAARALGFSQPAVSQQMRALERAVRTPLVLREGGRTRLTEAGEVMLGHARHVLARMSMATNDVAAIAGLEAGSVRVVAFPSSSAALLPRALAEATHRHPGLSFKLTEAEPPASLELLREAACDVAVAYTREGQDDADESGLVQIPLYEDAMRLALPQGHKRARGKRRVPMTSLRDERWVTGCPQCRSHLVDACEQAAFEPEIAFVTDDYVALHNLVAEGLGVALVSDLMVAGLRPDRVVLRRLDPTPVRTISAFTTRALATVPAVQATLQALARAGAKLREQTAD